MSASDKNFIYYKGGVIKDCTYSAGPAGVDHAVLMVGFQTSNDPNNVDENYLLVKNSWGPSWGEKGHFKVYHPLSNNIRVSKCFLCNFGYFSMF
jgi:xylem cysteine proteinase